MLPKGRRSLVMEDLGDETLVRISTPKKQETISLLDEAAADRGRKAHDDSDLPQKPKAAAAWGAGVEAEEEPQTRRMFDKRELRKKHKVVFDQQLTSWRAAHLDPVQASPPLPEASTSRVRVCVRKRPLFRYEQDVDEFDVLSVRGSTELVVHNCLTKADLRSLFVSHMCFQFAHAFGEEATDDEVYSSCAAPAIQHVAAGGIATLFMFGQTGSGKTHTMAGLLRRTAEQFFPDSGERFPLRLEAFEIAGKTMRDLLDTGEGSKELRIMEDKDHRTRVLGVSSFDIDSAQDLMDRIKRAQAQRATRATQVNDTSSRSHAVYRMSLAGEPGPPAVLTLVDCAGSERKEDSTHHDVQSRKDAVGINSTIFALKECFRVMRSCKGQQPPYRESLLTRVLSDSFSSDRALIVAIGTVSPSATDTEHSIGTLRALQQLQGTQMSSENREDIGRPKTSEPHPRSWSEEEVRHWVEEALGARGRPLASAITKGTDGKNLVRWPVQRFYQLCGGDEELGGRLYQDLRLKIRAAGGGGV